MGSDVIFWSYRFWDLSPDPQDTSVKWRLGGWDSNVLLPKLSGRLFDRFDCETVYPVHVCASLRATRLLTHRARRAGGGGASSRQLCHELTIIWIDTARGWVQCRLEWGPRIHVEAEVLMLLVQHPMKRPSLALLCLANLRFFPDQVAIAWHGSEKTQKIYKNDPDNDHKKMSIWTIWWEPHRYRHKKGINTRFSHKTLGKKQGNKHVWWWSGITCFFAS